MLKSTVNKRHRLHAPNFRREVILTSQPEEAF